MKILAIGDVVGSIGCNYLRKKLPSLKKEYNIDFVIANGENSADGNGITPFSANYLFNSGVDVITTGNHSFRRREIFKMFDENSNLIRPANFPENSTPGVGYCVVDMLKYKIIVINLIGTIYMESMPCPFKTVQNIISNFSDKDIILVDFHAEATSEKRAMGFFLDGKVTAVFGTHTHVPTADACLLPNGTAYLTDLGMTGVIHSNLGVKPDIIIKKLITKLPIKFENAIGDCKMDCFILDIDECSRKVVDFCRLTV